ncbi:MAG: UDP-N-acetylmuramoyl-L-alanyl-D-glutamate--2,6-diaminopimelate ligase [Deferribacterales bacterium]|nr:UDP-N-acetylmuramoyl-L-alanyl-D-glutamate--2,6-diaminopimelate ligase [Deferribacterales bacterium]
MLISDMLAAISPLNIAVKGEIENLKIDRISFDSRSQEKATVFFAYKGDSYDSNPDAENLYKNGLADFIVSEVPLEKNIPHAVVKDGRKALALTVSLFFDNPLQKYSSVAITGTNGKTTISYLLESIFKSSGCKAVRIGTIGAQVGDCFYPLDNTTPSAYDFYSILNKGLEMGCSCAAMEVSSHALAQNRIGGAKFSVAVFTNLTGDHLDFHKTMNSYFASKAILFSDDMSCKKVVNIGSDYGKLLAAKVKDGLITYSLFGDADIYPVKCEYSVNGTDVSVMVFGKTISVKSTLTGNYNLENILGAIGAAYALNISEDHIIKGISSLENVPGRLERVQGHGFTVFVDYAHTDDALKNVLVTLRKVVSGRIITVFGAGGDRDNTKRPRMGKTASELSDITIVTSDNPRTENPNDIISQIVNGISDLSSVIVEPDREKAIEKAINTALKDDVILIAGKGHEDYQIIGKTKYPFDDKLIAKKYIDRAKKC